MHQFFLFVVWIFDEAYAVFLSFCVKLTVLRSLNQLLLFQLRATLIRYQHDNIFNLLCLLLNAKKQLRMNPEKLIS